MQFVYPSFLWALLVLSIPLIIHLFNFRRFKKVYFPDIRFLKEAQVQTRQKRKVKNILVLIARMLALAFIVLAFAQPVIKKDNAIDAPGVQAISLFIDNSFSMENVNSNGQLLEEAKKAAGEIARSYSGTDQFQLLTHDFEGRHHHLLTREEFLSALDDLTPTSSVKMLSEIRQRQAETLAGSDAKGKRAFIISDFQKSICDPEKLAGDTIMATTLVKIASPQTDNLFIDSCWLETPVIQKNKRTALKVRIRNLSANALENIPVRLKIDGKTKSPATFNIEKQSEQIINFSFLPSTAGWHKGEVSLTDYPVTYDDRFFFSCYVPDTISVGCIYSTAKKTGNDDTIDDYDPTRALRSLLAADSLFTLSLYDDLKLDYSNLVKHQVIFIAGLQTISSGLISELHQFVKNGGSLVVFPHHEIDTAAYKELLAPMGSAYYLRTDTGSAKVKEINYEAGEFTNVFEKKSENIDLPWIKKWYAFSRSERTNEELLLKMNAGRSFFSKYIYEKGKVYVSAVSLHPEWSNFSQHAIFVPLTYNLILLSQPDNKLFYTNGRDQVISTHARLLQHNEVYHIVGEKGFEFIPEASLVGKQIRLHLHDQIQEAGNYDLRVNDQNVAGLSLNYDRKESELAAFEEDELASLINEYDLPNYSVIETGTLDAGRSITQLSKGQDLWKWCLLLALFFFGTEIALLRLLKS